MLHLSRISLFLLFCLCCSVSLCGERIIAEDGRSQYVVVMPEKCHASFAREISAFVNYLKEMTGVDFQSIRDSQWDSQTPAISIGDTCIARDNGIFCSQMKREEYTVRTCGSHILLAGRSYSGTIYAMYDFLEKQCGCRWYNDYFAKIPKHAKLAVNDIEIQRAPDFQMRRIFTGGGDVFYKNGPHATAFKNAMKATYLQVPDRAYGRPGDIHTFWQYAKDWPKDNVALLSKTPEGKPRLMQGSLGPNFCLSNPECAERITASLRNFIKQDRKDAARDGAEPPFIYNISQNDASHYYCCCHECQAIVDKLGQSGLLLTFINKVARAIAAEFPEIVIQTCAYEFSYEPPKGDIRPEPNVVMDLAHTKGNYYSPVAEDAECRDWYLAWSKTTKQLSVWDYWIFFWDSYETPYHNIYRIKSDLDFYRNLGMRFLRIESENPAYSSFFSLKRYLGYKLMDDLSQNENELIKDFMEGYYGPAANEMLDFMNYVTSRQKGQNCSVFGQKKTGEIIGFKPWLDHGFFARAEDIFNRAEAKCQQGSAFLRHVHRERIPVDIALLNMFKYANPDISLEELIQRNTDNVTEQIKLYVQEDAIVPSIQKLQASMDVFRNMEEIEAKKKQPKPKFLIPSNNGNWGTISDFSSNNGTKAQLSLELKAKIEENKLHLRMIQNNIKSRIVMDKLHVWDNDDWEIFLAENRDGEYFQLLVDANKNHLELHHKNGVNEKIAIQGLELKSTIDGDSWKMEITIPLNALPIKTISYGNFFRGSSTTPCAWSPTFHSNFFDVKAFGSIEIAE